MEEKTKKVNPQVVKKEQPVKKIVLTKVDACYEKVEDLLESFFEFDEKGKQKWQTHGKELKNLQLLANIVLKFQAFQSTDPYTMARLYGSIEDKERIKNVLQIYKEKNN